MKKFISGLILGAGASQRFGPPKQLLPFRGTTMLGWVVDQAQQAAALDEVVVVLGRFVKQLCESCDVGGLRFPLASGKSRRDLLKQPAVTIRIRERRKREIRTTFRVAPGNARVLHGLFIGPPAK